MSCFGKFFVFGSGDLFIRCSIIFSLVMKHRWKPQVMKVVGDTLEALDLPPNSNRDSSSSHDTDKHTSQDSDKHSYQDSNKESNKHVQDTNKNKDTSKNVTRDTSKNATRDTSKNTNSSQSPSQPNKREKEKIKRVFWNEPFLTETHMYTQVSKKFMQAVPFKKVILKIIFTLKEYSNKRQCFNFF
ncbi:hypothetical protein RFI_17256 [Reticulomyxa filosa]|uniref:Uncharacterized protein n=1 Tax=Reticulomyxa filosa TaxID=46433 RepID=X6N247_RETFI|nr:hypothetical protein RFI_17256 [Reticulomyxa filosa]|eukprot:ETO19963.1 hypothetical protein RFI_17256 [Reticulomyxa filosa]